MYASKAQERYFHANRKKLEAQGVNVAEWDAASKDAKLPERIGKTHKQKMTDKLKRGMAGSTK